VAAFAVVTLSFQRKRRCKVADNALLFWRTGMATLNQMIPERMMRG
jgi:hypothetical protein